jgi:hypothetical protein
MNRETEKEARAQSGAGPVVVDLRDRVPAMADAALTTLHGNAVRLVTEGNAKQRAAATDLLPVIEAELEKRRAEKRASAPAKAPRTVKKKTKAAAQEAADESAAD